MIASHYLTDTDRQGEAVGGKVVSSHPLPPIQVDLQVKSLDWLAPYRHRCIYLTDSESVAGHTAIISYASAGDLCRFEGSSVRE
jgi:hypothetical protein